MKSLTPSEKYEALNALISDKELKFGCEVSVQNYGKWNNYWVRASEGDFIRFESLVLQGKMAYLYGITEIKEPFYKKEPGYKILGTPPDLSRVLWWMRKVDRYDGKYFYEPMDEEFTFADLVLIRWDFAKPLLRDQIPELIEFLYGLLIQK